MSCRLIAIGKTTIAKLYCAKTSALCVIRVLAMLPTKHAADKRQVPAEPDRGKLAERGQGQAPCREQQEEQRQHRQVGGRDIGKRQAQVIVGRQKHGHRCQCKGQAVGLHTAPGVRPGIWQGVAHSCRTPLNGKPLHPNLTSCGWAKNSAEWDIH